MRKLTKKVISSILLFSFLFVFTVCCCLDEKSVSDRTSSAFSVKHHDAHQLAKVDHSDHQSHSDEHQECVCPKHVSFLLAQSTDIVFSSRNQMLAKEFMASIQFENVSLLASLTYQTHGPPQDRLYQTVPIYRKTANLRL